MSTSELSNRIISALDMGTTKICAVIAEIDEHGDLKLLGVGRAPSTGIRRGMIVNIKETISSIEDAVTEAETQADIKMDGVYVSLSGEQIRSMNNTGVIAVSRGDARMPSTQEISEDDITRVLDQAKAITLPNEREILHVLPQEFKVDQHDDIKDPLGHLGHRLEARVHLVTAVTSATQNFIRCVQDAGLYVEDLVLSPLASAYSVLDETEMEQGVALVDLGGGTTDVIVYYGGGVRASSVIPLGGNRVTNDIAQILHTTFQKAEEIKREHGYAKIPLDIEDQELTIDGIAGRQAQTTTRRDLADIIESRLEEILKLAKNEMNKSEVADKMTFGVVLTGGGILLKEIREKAGEVFNTDIKIGLPLHIEGLEEIIDTPEYATVTGLLLYGLEHQAKYGPGKRTRTVGGFFTGIVDSIKNLFKEL